MKLLTKASYSDQVTQRELRNREIAYRAACDSIVLLKNEGVLPFHSRKIAAFGPGISHTVKGGTGSGEVNERYSVSILNGLKNRGFLVSSERWLEAYRNSYDREYEKFNANRLSSVNLLKPTSLMNDVLKGFQPPVGDPVTQEDLQASDTDSCIYVVSRQAGEGGDRRPVAGDYLLTDKELEDIRLCASWYRNFVLVLNCGSVMDTSVLDQVEGIGAVLYISQLGTEGGNAVADILSGEAVPSGKLADTWAMKYEDIPFSADYSGVNGKVGEELYREGIYVGYRYFDTFGIRPRFPFGYGLSYTSFELTETQVAAEGSRIRVCCRVTNTGVQYSGREIVQVYVSAPSGHLDREFQSLTGFAKTKLLDPGETEEVRIEFDLRQAGGYSFEKAGYLLEAGDYLVRVGTSSDRTEAAAALRLTEEVQLSRNAHICPRRAYFDELTAPNGKREEASVPVLVLDASVFETETHIYETPASQAGERARAFVRGLSVQEMAEIVVGTGMNGKQGKFLLPGSVGNTTSALWDKGLVNVPLCDGPAGLRIQQKSGVDEKGHVKPYEFTFSVLGCLPKGLTRPFLAGKDATPIYQFCTAFPVASALAQTWDEDLMNEIGGAILEEMKEYGCVFWLAPAINIHRNPLCGRNFEYFSEDPFLTGKLAAALIRGVQSEPGYYVTIKHFACNNQEDNRNHVSSNLTERTLREIYLRAFEICVKEAGAKAVMTSYNRLNGVYTANSHDLCTKVLRNEWGFRGVVMTDWLSTGPGMGSSAAAMTAGNDLIMPGGRSFKSELLAGLKKGITSKEDLTRCCENVVQAIMDSAIQKEYMDECRN